MERETTSFTTSGGHAVVIKTYLTGREANQFKEIIYSKISFDGAQQSAVKLTGSVLLEQELAAIELCVISLDGKDYKDSNSDYGLKDAVQDLPAPDYKEISEKVAELTKDLFPTPSKGSGGSNTSNSAQ